MDNAKIEKKDINLFAKLKKNDELWMSGNLEVSGARNAMNKLCRIWDNYNNH